MMMQDVDIHVENNWFILQSQYYGYWCPCSLRRQSMCSHGIDLVLPPYCDLGIGDMTVVGSHQLL